MRLLVLGAFASARVGWRRPELSLIIPSATLVNAIFFHILPTVVQGRAAPGVYTATLLYLPFSTWALVGASLDGVPRRVVVQACVGGAAPMACLVAGAKALSVR